MVINSFLYKFVLVLVVALCGVESFDYLVNNTPPNPDIAAMGMLLCCCLLLERLYVVLWVENKLKGH